jgi:hypothetical protein
MIIDIEQRNNQGKSELYVSYLDRDGTIDYITLPLAPKDLFNWVEAGGMYEAEKDMTTWDDKPVKKLSKSDKRYSWENSNREFFRLSKYRIEEIISERLDVMAPAHEYNRPKI